MKGVEVWTPDWAQVLKDLDADTALWHTRDRQLAPARVSSLSGIDGAAATAAPLATAGAEAGNSISFEGITVAYRGTVVLENSAWKSSPAKFSPSSALPVPARPRRCAPSPALCDRSRDVFSSAART
ncbi:MAG: hypothetical protein WDM84_03125 [Bauldia sp.]